MESLLRWCWWPHVAHAMAVVTASVLMTGGWVAAGGQGWSCGGHAPPPLYVWALWTGVRRGPLAPTGVLGGCFLCGCAADSLYWFVAL